MTDQFDGWRSLLAGKPVQFDANDPLPGYYKIRKGRNGDWESVGIWQNDMGAIVVMLNGSHVPIDRVWPWCAKYPISYETYADVAEDGKPWPNQHAAVTKLHNAPPEDDSIEIIGDRIEDLVREAKTLIENGAAKSQDESDKAADLANEIAKQRKKADDARDAEGRPHLEAKRAVDGKWRPLLDAAEIYKQLKDAVCAPWLAAQRAAKQKAEAEARKAAQEAAKAGDIEAAAEATRKAEHIAATRTVSGTRGRSVHLQTTEVVSIIDRTAVLAFFAESPAITEVLQSLAEKAIAAGVVVPGTKVDKEERAR